MDDSTSQNLKPGQFQVSNRTLMAVLVSLFTWELEVFVVLIRWLGLGSPPTTAWLILLAVFTVASVPVPRRDADAGDGWWWGRSYSG